MAKGGRPTEYKEEYCDMVHDYLAENTDIFDENGKLKEVNLPTVSGFASFLGVSWRVLYDWKDVHPRFLQALEVIEREQYRRLLNRGLSDDYNSNIAKLVLSSNHGLRERSDYTTNEKDITPDPETKAKADNAIDSYLEEKETRN